MSLVKRRNYISRRSPFQWNEPFWKWQFSSKRLLLFERCNFNHSSGKNQFDKTKPFHGDKAISSEIRFPVLLGQIFQWKEGEKLLPFWNEMVPFFLMKGTISSVKFYFSGKSLPVDIAIPEERINPMKEPFSKKGSIPLKRDFLKILKMFPVKWRRKASSILKEPFQ